jgi:GTPase SAR1 family protein
MQGPMGISAPDTIEELKLVIVGDSDVGKTSLCMRYCHGAAVAVSPTIGASFLQKRTSVAEDVSEIRSSGGDSGNVDADEKGVVKTEVVMQLWDTAGQERCE